MIYIDMEAFIEIFKPCLVLLGPFLFFAFKRLSELQEARRQTVNGLTVQDFVEKLTKTPLHMKKCRKILNKEKQILFEKEKHLQCRCKALKNRLDYEISKNEHLNSLYVDQIFRQGELLKEIHYLKTTLKKLRKQTIRRTRYSAKVFGKAACYQDCIEVCKYCWLKEHSNTCSRHLKGSCEQIDLGDCWEESPTKDRSCRSPPERRFKNLIFDENNDEQSTKCTDNQLSYYQTFFS